MSKKSYKKKNIDKFIKVLENDISRLRKELFSMAKKTAKDNQERLKIEIKINQRHDEIAGLNRSKYLLDWMNDNINVCI